MLVLALCCFFQPLCCPLFYDLFLPFHLFLFLPVSIMMWQELDVIQSGTDFLQHFKAQAGNTLLYCRRDELLTHFLKSVLSLSTEMTRSECFTAAIGASD